MNDIVKHQATDDAGQKYLNLLTVAIDKNLDIDKLEKLMALQREWEANNARKEFFEALSRFQSEIPEIGDRGLARFPHKNGAGETTYRFAKLEDIARAIQQPLYNNGLSYRFEQTQSGDSFDKQLITVTCVIAHKGGHTERHVMSSYPDTSGMKNAIQSIASTVSYLRRYTLTGGLGITTGGEDDDGHGGAEGHDLEQLLEKAKAYVPKNREPNEQETVVDFCSEEQYNAMATKWRDKIIKAQQGTEPFFAWLESKGVFLTAVQKDDLCKLVSEKEKEL